MAWWEQLGKGTRVDRAAATLPAGTAAAIFNIIGGRVLMTQIIGAVVVVIQTQANNTKLTMNPTTASARDICAVLNISAYQPQDLLGITGINTDAMIPPLTAGSVEGQTVPVALTIGTLDLDCAATNSGTIAWSLWYLPLEDGAYVTAA